MTDIKRTDEEENMIHKMEMLSDINDSIERNGRIAKVGWGLTFFNVGFALAEFLLGWEVEILRVHLPLFGVAGVLLYISTRQHIKASEKLFRWRQANTKDDSS